MYLRVVAVLCGLIFCHSSLAEWQVAVTKKRGNRVLLQKDVTTSKGRALIAVMCQPKPTLYVEWFENLPEISVSIDDVELSLPEQYTLSNGLQAIPLKASHLDGLINGLNLQLKTTLTGETITAETTLLGFTSELAKANMVCSP